MVIPVRSLTWTVNENKLYTDVWRRVHQGISHTQMTKMICAAPSTGIRAHVRAAEF